MSEAVLGVFGGSGFYEMDGLTGVEELQIETEFGAPSDVIVKGLLHGEQQVYFLSRHARGHVIPPNAIPFPANVWAMKKLGVTHLLSVTAVGSLLEGIAPEHFVVVDQLYDHTKTRVPTFFNRPGIAAHVSIADPTCEAFREKVVVAAMTNSEEGCVHNGGILHCIEGPRFSTRAESETYRRWGHDVIGMTNLPEAQLAREAEICFATLALVTDYDCWRPSTKDVTPEEVTRVVEANVGVNKANYFIDRAFELDVSLDENQVELLLLIGYMRYLSKWFVGRYQNRIMNIHPSLLPAFAGGMDKNVHEAVLEHGAKITGCTLHFVDEGQDTGPIILQKAVEVGEDETVDTLKEKVQKAEQEIIVKGIMLFAAGKLAVKGRKVVVDD